MASRVGEEVQAAINAVKNDNVTAAEKAEMLMEIAMGLQVKPKSPDQILSAIELYENALSICPPEHFLLHARIQARMATALQAIPASSSDYLKQARSAYQAAKNVFKDHGTDEENAETEMNLGLVIQTLAATNEALITDAISAYQRALRIFNREKHPKEFAILHNNLATAFLSIPFTDQRSKMREALAVQSFEDGLKVVNLIDHPTEYAMLQNNLGNALQYSSSSHAVENNLRALEAYDEALKVRTLDTSPLGYANTLSNKANCLLNLPDVLDEPEMGNPQNLKTALDHYTEAQAVFLANGAAENAALVEEIITEIASGLSKNLNGDKDTAGDRRGAAPNSA